MSWSALVLIATAIIAVGSIIEKQLVSRYLPDTSTFLGWMALSMLPHALVMALLYPVPPDTPLDRVLILVAGGMSWGVAGNLMYRVLRGTEVSRVWPVLNISPVFVAIMAIFFLGEHLGPWQWVAILVTVCGTVLISVQRSSDGGSFRLERTFFLLVLAALFMALGQISQKHGLEEVPALTGFWLIRVGMFLPLAVNLRGSTLRNIVASARAPRVAGLILAAEFVVFPVAILMIVRATELGPIALIATIMGTVPVWVLLLSSLLSTRRWNVLNEPLQRGTLALKASAVLLIVAGVAGVTLL